MHHVHAVSNAPQQADAPGARVRAGPPPLASLPMYTSLPAQVEAFWQALARRLHAAGVEDVPPHLAWPADGHVAHWRDPALLLSQACGYPLVTVLAGRVRVVGGFHYLVPGAGGVWCRSALVTRVDEPTRDLAALRGRCVAYNSTDSQSGYNCLRALVAQLTTDGRFFGGRLQTGSHRASVEAVRDGLADIAAIDCVSLAGFARTEPAVMRGIRVMGYSDPYPGLPLITSVSTSGATLAALRAALAQVVHDPALQALREDLFITGFEPLEASAYQVCADMRESAAALGCLAL